MDIMDLAIIKILNQYGGEKFNFNPKYICNYF